jgi:dTDP-4-dehydrorhamnose reductase
VFSVLDTTEYEQLTGHVPDHWEKALSRYFRQRMVAAKT